MTPTPTDTDIELINRAVDYALIHDAETLDRLANA